MKHLFSFFIGISISAVILAQNKLLTAKDAELAARRGLSPANLMNMQWRGASANFTYQDKSAVYQQSVNDSNTIALITLDEINQAIKMTDTMSALPNITWENENEFHFFTDTYWHIIKIHDKEVILSVKFPEGATNFKVFYPKKLIAYTLGNNVFIAGANGYKVAVTSESNPDIVNGDIVSRSEFGINEGLFWSPLGNYLAFYRKDNRKVKDYPVVDITAREAELKNMKYPMAGMPSEHISVGIYQIASGSKVFIEKEDTVSEKYLTNISWAPNEIGIYIQVLNRQQTHMTLNKYNVSDGLFVKTLFEERNNKYVEPQNPILFSQTMPEQFIYQSRRDGYNHAYLYNTDGVLIKQLTSGKCEITGIIAFDSGDNLFFTSTEESPIEKHAYKLNIKTQQKTKLTQQAGVHNITVSSDSKYCIDKYSNTTTPRIINIVSASGKVKRTVLKASNPLINFKMPEMRIGTVKAADGTTDLYYRIIKPVDFDTTKKYPAIIYVYGGPHLQLITNTWLGGARLSDYLLAQKGYVILTVDNRGSSNRGLDFENVIYRQCGVAEMQDQLEGLKLLEKLGYVDMNRIGVQGWSYGGFMTISLMVNYPEIFKVGIAGGPVIDWKYYEVMYGERYMDSPEENPQGYEITALPAKAKNLKGKLLIIHGAIDPTVVWQNSLVFIQECIKNEVPVDYFVYPQAEHNVRGSERVHLTEKVTDYFERNL